MAFKFEPPPQRYMGKGKIGLRGGGGGVTGAPRTRGGWSGNGAPVTETMVKSQFFFHFCHFFTEFRN